MPTLPIQCRYRAALQCNEPIVAHLMHHMVRVNKIVISTAGSDCEKHPSEMYKENRDTQRFISGPRGRSSFLSTTIPFSELAAATSFPRVEWKAGGGGGGGGRRRSDSRIEGIQPMLVHFTNSLRVSWVVTMKRLPQGTRRNPSGFGRNSTRDCERCRSKIQSRCWRSPGIPGSPLANLTSRFTGRKTFTSLR